MNEVAITIVLASLYIEHMLPSMPYFVCLLSEPEPPMDSSIFMFVLVLVLTCLLIFLDVGAELCRRNARLERGCSHPRSGQAAHLRHHQRARGDWPH